MTNQEAVRILNEQRNKFMDEWVDFGGVNEAYNMAIVLLKDQEPINPEIEGAEHTWYYACGGCHGAIDYHDKFCRHCGQAVKWE